MPDVFDTLDEVGSAAPRAPSDVFDQADADIFDEVAAPPPSNRVAQFLGQIPETLSTVTSKTVDPVLESIGTFGRENINRTVLAPLKLAGAPVKPIAPNQSLIAGWLPEVPPETMRQMLEFQDDPAARKAAEAISGVYTSLKAGAEGLATTELGTLLAAGATPIGRIPITASFFAQMAGHAPAAVKQTYAIVRDPKASAYDKAKSITDLIQHGVFLALVGKGLYEKVKPKSKAPPVIPGEPPPPIIQVGAENAPPESIGDVKGPPPVPENVENLQSQVNLTADPGSSKAATHVTPGATMPEVPEGLVVLPVANDGGTVIVNPAKANPEAVAQRAAAGQHGLDLGFSQAVKPNDTSTTMLQTRNAEGVSVLEEVITPEQEAAARQAHAAAVPGGSSQVVSLGKVLAERDPTLDAAAQEQFGKTFSELTDNEQRTILTARNATAAAAPGDVFDQVAGGRETGGVPEARPTEVPPELTDEPLPPAPPRPAPGPRDVAEAERAAARAARAAEQDRSAQDIPKPQQFIGPGEVPPGQYRVTDAMTRPQVEAAEARAQAEIQNAWPQMTPEERDAAQRGRGLPARLANGTPAPPAKLFSDAAVSSAIARLRAKAAKANAPALPAPVLRVAPVQTPQELADRKKYFEEQARAKAEAERRKAEIPTEPQKWTPPRAEPVEPVLLDESGAPRERAPDILDELEGSVIRGPIHFPGPDFADAIARTRDAVAQARFKAPYEGLRKEQRRQVDKLVRANSTEGEASDLALDGLARENPKYADWSENDFLDAILSAAEGRSKPEGRVDREATAAAQDAAVYEAFGNSLKLQGDTIFSHDQPLASIRADKAGRKFIVATPEGESLPPEYQRAVMAKGGIEMEHGMDFQGDLFAQQPAIREIDVSKIVAPEVRPEVKPVATPKARGAPGATPLEASKQLILAKLTASRDWFMDGPNWYRNVRKQMERELYTQKEVTFELRDVTDYGGIVWVHFPDAMGGKWNQLTKGKLRYGELGFYGLHPRPQVEHGMPDSLPGFGPASREFDATVMNDLTQVAGGIVEAGRLKYPDFARAMSQALDGQYSEYYPAAYDQMRHYTEAWHLRQQMTPRLEMDNYDNTGNPIAGGNRTDPVGQNVPGTLGTTGRRERPRLRVVDEGDLPAPRAHVRSGEYQGPQGYAIDEVQRFAVNSVLTAFENGKSSYLLGDGTGVGKTGTELAIASQSAQRTKLPSLIVVPNRQVLETRFQTDLARFGIPAQGIEFATYDDLAGGKVARKPYGVVIFDEAQKLKTYASLRSTAGRLIDAKTKIFATATPMDSPPQAAYFLAELTGRSRETVAAALGFKFEMRPDRATGVVKEHAVLLDARKFSWHDVVDNLKRYRNQAVREGQLLRREYPFYGQVALREAPAFTPAQLKEQLAIRDYWEARIAKIPPYAWQARSSLAKQRTGELVRWAESQKIQPVLQAALADLAAGKRVIIFGERINASQLKSTPVLLPGPIEEISKALDKAGIPHAKIYGGGNKTEAVKDFQSDRVKIAVATGKSGGAGIDLDDVFGDRPRQVHTLGLDFSAEVMDQMFGRVSRRNTASPADFHVWQNSQSYGDARKTAVMDRKLRVLRNIQAGEDLDLSDFERTAGEHGFMAGNVRITAPREAEHDFPAYHGTPHEVDQFTTAKIGTGEGAQVYGWGLYFAENPSVAFQYASRLGKSSEVEVGGRVIDRNQQNAVAYVSDRLGNLHRAKTQLGEEASTKSVVDAVREDMQVRLKIARKVNDSAVAENLIQQLEALKNMEREGINLRAASNQYTVDLDVKPEELLDWDKPLSEQSEKVRKALDKGWLAHPEAHATQTGATIYHEAQGKFLYGDNPSEGPRQASEKLAALGIKGIRYLDQGSRVTYPLVVTELSGRRFIVSDQTGMHGGAQEFSSRDAADNYIRQQSVKTYNYVIFDEKDIQITHKNGQPVKPSQAVAQAEMEHGMAAFAEQDGFSFDPVESSAELAARLAREETRQRIDDGRLKMAQRAQERLTGTTGDLGQGDLLGAPADLWAAREREHGMAGYAQDFSKSNNAIAAERGGRFPATEVARQLGVPARFIKDHAPKSGEWHHTSKFYNTTEYYDLEQVREWMEGTGEYAPTGKEATGNDMLAEWRMRQLAAKEAGSTIVSGLSVKYLEWSGTRNHPHATEVTEHNVSIERKPGAKMLTITRPDGSSFRKGLETRGFQIGDATGKWWDFPDLFYKFGVEKHQKADAARESGAAGIKTQLESRLTDAESGAGSGSTPRLEGQLNAARQSSSSTFGDGALRPVPPSESSRMVSGATSPEIGRDVNAEISHGAPAVPAGGVPGLPVEMNRAVAGSANVPEINAALEAVSRAAGGNTPIRSGRFYGAGNRGIYKERQEVVRLRSIDDLPAATHEIAHDLSKQVFGSVSAGGKVGSPAAIAEMEALGQALYGPVRPLAGYAGEGWAEFLRTWLSTEDAAKVAPALTRWFEGTFLPANTAVAAALARARSLITTNRYMGSVARAQAQLVREPGAFRRVAEALGKFVGYQSQVEKFAPIERLVREAEARAGKLAPADNPFLLASWKRGSAGATVERMATTHMIDVWGNPSGPSLSEVLAPVKGKRNEFMLYLFARRAMERWNKTKTITDPVTLKKSTVPDPKNPGISLADAQHIYGLYSSPEFRLAAQGYYEWWDGVLNYAVQADPAMADVVRAVKQGSYDYAPLARMIDPKKAKAAAAAAQSNPLMRMHGSGLPVKDIFDQTFISAARIINRANRSLVSNAIVKLANIEGMGHVIEAIPRGRVRNMVSLDQVRAQLEDLGIDTSTMPRDRLMEYWTPADLPKGSAPIVAVGLPGNRQWFQVDPKLYETLDGLQTYSLKQAFPGIPHLGTVLDLVLGAPARVFRLGTTGLRPAFSLVTNPVRDLQTLLVQTSVNPAKVAAAYPAALAGVIREGFGGKAGPYVQAFYDLGAHMGQPLGLDISHTKRVSNELFHGRTLRIVKSPVDHLRQLFSITEAGPRVAELQAVAEKIGWKPGTPITPDQAVTLGLAAKRVTVDFSAMGDVSRVLNQAVPFYNPSIQGLRAFGRTFQEHPARTVLLGAALFAAPTLANWWANKDKEWYRAMPWRERYLKTWIDDGKNLWGIARPFEWGMAFMAAPEAMLDAWHRQDPQAVKEMLGAAFDTVNPLDYPVVLKAAKEQWQNRIAYFDKPIVPRSLEGLPASEQKQPYTSSLALGINKAFPNVSPLRADAFVRSFFGGAGPDALNIIGLGAPRSGRDWEPSDIPAFGVLFRHGGQFNAQNQWINDFYDRYGPAQAEVEAWRIARKRAAMAGAEQPPMPSSITMSIAAIGQGTSRVPGVAAQIRFLMVTAGATKDNAARSELYRQAGEVARNAVENVAAMEGRRIPPERQRQITHTSTNSAAMLRAIGR